MECSDDDHTCLPLVPACCCATLTSTSTLSPWDTVPIQKSKTLKILKTHSEFSLKHNKKVLDEDHIAVQKIITPSPCSSKQASFTSHVGDSKNLLANSRHLLNYEIPYQFAHQSSPNRAIKDYRRAHTYPTMQKRVVSAYAAEKHSDSRRYSSYGYVASASMPHITAALRPKMILLGEYYVKDGHRKQLCKGRDNAPPPPAPPPPPPPPPPKRLINCSLSRKALNRPRKLVEYELQLKMRLVSHPLPSFIVKPSKSVDINTSSKGEKASSTIDREKNRCTVKDHIKGGGKSRGLCNIIPPEGTELRVQVPNSRIQSFTYNYMAYCQQKTQQAKTGTHNAIATANIGTNNPEVYSKNPPASSSTPKSVVMITSPWGDHG